MNTSCVKSSSFESVYIARVPPYVYCDPTAPSLSTQAYWDGLAHGPAGKPLTERYISGDREPNPMLIRTAYPEKEAFESAVKENKSLEEKLELFKKLLATMDTITEGFWWLLKNACKKTTKRELEVIPPAVRSNNPYWSFPEDTYRTIVEYIDQQEFRSYFQAIHEAGWTEANVSPEEWRLFLHWCEPHLANNQKM